MIRIMQKNYLKFLLFTVCLVACQHAIAFDIEADGIYYNVTSSTDLTAEVTNGTNKYTGEVTIPSTIEFRGKQLSVTRIGMQAFKDCTGLTSVSFSEGLVSIGYEAFSGCSNLENVTFPASLRKIEDMYAFGYCKKLANVTLQEGIEYIGGYAFYGCEGITEISIPRSVNKTGFSIFGNCINLRKAFLPKNITELKHMFYQSTNLETLRVEGALPPKVENEYSFFDKEVLLNATLYVPKNASETYKSNDYWKGFFVIEEDETLGTCYYLNVTCGSNGRIDIGEQHISNNSTPVIIGGFEGDNIDLAFVPLNGYSGKKYRIKSFTMNDVELVDKIEDNAYSFNLIEDKTIIADFVRYYDVTISSEGDEGSVTVNGETLHNSSKTFMIDEWVPTEMHIDVEEGYYAKAEQMGYFSAFKQIDDTTFVLEQPIDFTVSFTFPKIHIQLYSTCKGNGVFYTNGSPITSKSVYLNTGCYYFDNVNLKCVPEQGYHLASLLIDSVEVINQVMNNEYNFTAKARKEIKMICTFEEGEPSGIDGILDEQHTYTIYGIEGRRKDRTSRGINIIRQSNGTTKKIIIK